MKNISIIGSTGSIGTQALDIIRNRREEFRLVAISANKNVELLYEQALEFMPEYIAVMDEDGYRTLKERLDGYKIQVLKGMEGLIEIATIDSADIVLTSVVGMIGLKPTIAAIRAGKKIALANKETLVSGGEIVTRELKRTKSEIVPVDSEHCALFQCLNGENKKNVRRLILTASGGPFRGRKRNELQNISPEEALKHPRWNMGKKISIDSATLMNKALEIIEAHWLFGIDYDNIDVVIHPQSIIHSMVEYVDGSILAQLSNTDMRHPIQYAFDYPQRKCSSIGYLDFAKNSSLTFEEPDYDTFECLKLGFDAGKTGGTMPAALNAANEEAVNYYLNGRINFLDISEIIKRVVDNHKTQYDYDLERILEVDRETREYVRLLLK